MTDAATLQRTPLHERHLAAGARMVPFAGWQMPVQYSGVIAEHLAVRSSAGIFDVSHMGQLHVAGAGARNDLQRLLSNDIERLDCDGKAQYTLLTNAAGGIDDDLIVYRVQHDQYLLVVNAANVRQDFGRIRDGVGDNTVVEDHSRDYAMLALQGPVALDVLADVLVDVRRLGNFRFETVQHIGRQVLVATTGYTGERGCEILTDATTAVSLWEALSSDARVVPCGLGARDTLRLEACYPLHGSDIDATTTPTAAGLDWACGWHTDFTGRDAIEAERAGGIDRILVAIEITERGIPRAGHTVCFDGAVVGNVTSGTMSPTLGHGIALAYVDVRHSSPGTAVEIDVRGTLRPARIARKPLYERKGT